MTKRDKQFVMTGMLFGMLLAAVFYGVSRHLHGGAAGKLDAGTVVDIGHEVAAAHLQPPQMGDVVQHDEKADIGSLGILQEGAVGLNNLLAMAHRHLRLDRPRAKMVRVMKLCNWESRTTSWMVRS